MPQKTCPTEVLSATTGPEEPEKKASGWDATNEERLGRAVSYLLDLLPSPDTLDKRFWFDSAMIQATMESWTGGALRMSRVIIPEYQDHWGYRPVSLLEKSKTFHLIRFPGPRSLHSVDLLDYPWLCHELGHAVLHTNPEAFGNSFGPHFNRVTGGFRLRTIADRGLARSRSRATLDRLDAIWVRWSYEIAVDMVALWTCGPAFLATFDDSLEVENPDPFLVTEDHPPYIVRAAALAQSAAELNWGDYASAICNRLGNWSAGARSRNATNNEYATFVQDELVTTAHRSALQFCAEAKLPRCDASTIESVRDRMEANELDFGIDLLLAAWLHQREDGLQFPEWQRGIVREFANAVTTQ